MMATPIDSSISISFLFSAFLFLLLCSLNKGYASSDESTLKNHFHTIQISSLLPASVCSPSTKDHSKGASLKVVHKHGPCSHLSKEKANAATATQILTRDESRVNSIQSRLSFNLVQKTHTPPVSLKFLRSSSYSFTFNPLSRSCIAFSPLTVT